MEIKRGDFIQWTVGGVDQFPRLKFVREVSECGQYVFVIGSNTGIPVEQITKCFNYLEGYREI